MRLAKRGLAAYLIGSRLAGAGVPDVDSSAWLRDSQNHSKEFDTSRAAWC